MVTIWEEIAWWIWTFASFLAKRLFRTSIKTSEHHVSLCRTFSVSASVGRHKKRIQQIKTMPRKANRLLNAKVSYVSGNCSLVSSTLLPFYGCFGHVMSSLACFCLSMQRSVWSYSGFVPFLTVVVALVTIGRILQWTAQAPSWDKTGCILYWFCVCYLKCRLPVRLHWLFIFVFHSNPLDPLYKAHRAFLTHLLSSLSLFIFIGLSPFSATPLPFSS